MKKLMKLLLAGFVGIVVLGIIGFAMTDAPEEAQTETDTTEIADTDQEETPTEASSEPAEETPEEPVEEAAAESVGEPVKVGDVVYTVNEVTDATNVGGEYGQTAKGKYLVVNVTVKNEGNESLLVDTSLFNLVDGETTYDADGTASIYANEQSDFFLSQINPNIDITGNVVFDIPAEAHESDLLLNVKTGFFGTEQSQILLK